MLKQVQKNAVIKANKKNAHAASIDLTDDIEDGVNQSSEVMNVVAQPPALVAFRGNSQANSLNKSKPTTTYYMRQNSNPNKSVDKNAVSTQKSGKFRCSLV